MQKKQTDFFLPVITLIKCVPLCLLQPYYSTRMNASDIDSRVKQLDESRLQEQASDKDKIKAGFFEEFDVRLQIDRSSVLFAAIAARGGVLPPCGGSINFTLEGSCLRAVCLCSSAVHFSVEAGTKCTKYFHHQT